MELTQVGRRIVIQRWRLIVACVIVAVGGVLILERGQPSTYTAGVRLVLDTQDPTTRQEAAAIGDIAKAIATSPGQVSDALRKAGVTDRDPTKEALANVTVSPLGSSGLLELSVKDRSAKHAAAIANALAAAVIHTRLGFTLGASRTVLTDLDKRLTTLQERISRADARIAALNARGAGRTGDPLRSQREAVERGRQSLRTQEGVLESERVTLLTASAAKPRPTIVSAATPPAHADPSAFPVHLVLAVLLGLILGVGLAGLLEIIRPTVVGSDAVAREFGAPLLGTLPSAPDQEAALTDVSGLTKRLSLAMGATRVPNVSLLSAGPEVDLRPLAARLDATGSQTRVRAPVPVGAGSTAVAPSETPAVSERPEQSPGRLRVHADAAGAAQSTNGHAIGAIVVVAPSSLRMTDVMETTDLLRVSSIPVVGVITYIRPRR